MCNRIRLFKNQMVESGSRRNIEAMQTTRSPYRDVIDPLLREYFEKNGRLTAIKMEEIARQGRLPGCAPVGYLNTKTPMGEHRIVVDKEVSPLIREAFELAAEGTHSIREILYCLTAKGLRSRNGKVIKVSGMWSILQNPFYCGKIRFHFSVLPGTHGALIPEELFEKVQAQLRGRQFNRRIETA
jgi:hypothetical protein